MFNITLKTLEGETVDFGTREHAAIIFLDEVMLFVWPLVLGILLAHSTFSSVLVKILMILFMAKDDIFSVQF